MASVCRGLALIAALAHGSASAFGVAPLTPVRGRAVGVPRVGLRHAAVHRRRPAHGVLCAAAAEAGAAAGHARLEAYFGECTVRECVPEEDARLQSPAAVAGLVTACRETGGEVLVAVTGRRGDEELVAVAGARVQGASARLQVIPCSADGGDEYRELAPFLMLCMEAVCRQRHDLTVRCVLAAVVTPLARVTRRL